MSGLLCANRVRGSTVIKVAKLTWLIVKMSTLTVGLKIS